VTLLLSGKALRDTFVLERVMRAPQAVLVVLRDLSEVRLLSALALSGDRRRSLFFGNK
jgi:hypothetical protein